MTLRTKRILSEIVRMLLLLIAVSLIAFLLITNSPIDPLISYIGTNSTLSDSAKAEIVEHWDLNDPPIERFLTWAGNVLHGDMGESITYKRPVADIILERFSYSIVLMLSAWVLSGVFGFIIGIICGLKEGSFFDRITKLFCLTMKSAPTFWVGLLALMLFSVKLGWFPLGMAVPLGVAAEDVTIWDRLYHLVLPVFTLTIVSISEVVLYTRQKLIEILNSDFILYAKTRGENTKQLVFRHILRNIALPAITVQFASFSELFGGMALAENVFSYPGIGSAATAAAMNADVPLLLGVALCSALFVFTGNLIANLLYDVFDPRIKEGKQSV